MLNFVYSPGDDPRATAARHLIESWWDTEHSSTPKYLMPGHLIIVDGQVVTVVQVHPDHIDILLPTGKPSVVQFSENSARFRHPLSNHLAQRTIAALPPELHSVVRTAESSL